MSLTIHFVKKATPLPNNDSRHTERQVSARLFFKTEKVKCHYKEYQLKACASLMTRLMLIANHRDVLISRRV